MGPPRSYIILLWLCTCLAVGGRKRVSRGAPLNAFVLVIGVALVLLVVFLVLLFVLFVVLWLAVLV